MVIKIYLHIEDIIEKKNILSFFNQKIKLSPTVEECDLIISDELVSKKDLFQNSFKIKEKKKIPIIYLIQEYSNSILEQVFNFGAIDYFVKPCSKIAFDKKIQLSFNNLFFHDKIINKNKILNDNFLKLENYLEELKVQNKELLIQQENLKEKSEELNLFFLESPIPYILIDKKNLFIKKYNNEALKFFPNIIKSRDSDQSLLSFINPINHSLYFDLINLKCNNVVLEMKNSKKDFNYTHYKIEIKEITIKEKASLLLSFIDIENELLKIEHEKQLREQEKMLFKQHKLASLGEMINNIAHQWRQPLSFISTSASGIKFQRELGIMNVDEEIKTLQDIVTQTSYLSHTIEVFSDFIKSREDGIYKNIKISDEVERTKNILSSVLENLNIKLSFDYQDDLIVFGQSYQLSEVLINLINNAKDSIVEKYKNISEINKKNDMDKFIEFKGEISLKAYLENDYIYIIVEDNGLGINENIKESLFEPYTTTKHKSIGTGLGLNIAYEIISKIFNGILYTKDKENGAIFIIKIPQENK